MLEIKKILLKDLLRFIQSEEYKQFEVVPITPQRAKSFMENPRSLPDDIVLYLGFSEGKLVAFRSLFADLVSTKDVVLRFAWCSGNWVHPKYRRKGFSRQLLNEAYSDWEGRLMFTNYAPNSERLYLQTGKFHTIHHFNGVRGYLFPKMRKLVGVAGKNRIFKFVFSFIDIFISAVSSIRIFFYHYKESNKTSFETTEFPDKQCFEYLKTTNRNDLFNRKEAELKWIFEYPWISSTDKENKERYPFSSYSSAFYYHTVKIFQKGDFEGFFIFSVREGHLKTLFFCYSKKMEKEIANYLKKVSVSNKIEVITINNSEISEIFFNQKFPFLRTKKFGQKIYSSFQLPSGELYQFQDGDGDVFFT
ncbi:MAG: hypothetical protein R2757_10475 [Draconibacterium sp.]